MKLVNILKLDGEYLRNIGFQSGGNIAAQVINIASLPIITRLFDPSEIGLFNLFMQSIALVTILISLRAEHVVLLPRSDGHAGEILGFVASFGTLSSLAMTAIAAGLVFQGVVPDEYRVWVLILPVTSFLIVFAQATQQYSQRSADFRRSGMSEVVNRLANNLVAIGAGVAGLHGVWLGIATAMGFVGKLVVFRSSLRGLSPNLLAGIRHGWHRIGEQNLRRILGSMMLSHVMLALTMLLPLIYIGHRYGPEYTGHFSLVLGTLALPTTLIGNAVGHVFYQRASRQFSHGGPFDSLLIANARMLLLVAVPAFAFVGILGPSIYPLIFGAQWGVAGQTAQIYALAAAVSFLSVPFDRSGLIVNAWWYGPAWQFSRLATTVVVIYLCDVADVSYLGFVFWLTLQSTLLFVVDGMASYIFSKRHRKFSAVSPD
ncbi:MAG: lipopolysaccharide biosynthesis protein [Candidatus Puniceispirillaceae bacterium]